MKKIKTSKRRTIVRSFLFACIIGLFPGRLLFSQQIQGVVVSAGNKAVPDAEIRVKDALASTMTNAEGIFLIDAAPGSILLVKKDGYIPAEEAVNDRKEVTIQLEPVIDTYRSNRIDILYGKQYKQHVTGAYSVMQGYRIADNPVINNQLKLAGYLPGLTVLQSNGEPGIETARTLVRGKRTLRSNSPVYLIDGFERDISLLDPNEIESVTVLKDAAATAQYGLQGGNGIIMVTTRRGHTGKIRITFNANVGIKSATTKPEILNSYDYASLYNEAQLNDYDNGTRTAAQLNAFQPRYSGAVIEKYRLASQGIYQDELDPYLYPDVDWYDDYIRKKTWQQRYSIGVSGGNTYARYFVSAGYTNSSGIFNTDNDANTYETNANLNMFTIRSNVDIQATKRLLISLDLSGRQEQRTAPGDISEYVSRIFQSMYRTPPNAVPVLAPNGKPGGSKDYPDNPYGLLNKQGYSLYYIRNTYATVRVGYDLDFIAKGLSVDGAFSFDSWFDQETKRNKTFKSYAVSTTTNPDGTFSPVYNNVTNELKYIETGSDTQMGTGGDYPNTLRTLSLKFKLNYSRRFGDHDVSGLFGYTQRQISQEDNTNLPREYRGLNARLSYAFKDRYLVEFNAGYEGSEQMPNNKKYGFFPAVSAGWVLSEENILRGTGWLSFLKLRASYGLTGNDDTGGYFAYIQKYGKSTGNTFGTSFTGYNGWEESALAQENVTWEKISKTNAGIDASFFRNKLDLSFDYFYERNKDIMVDPPLSLLMGMKLPLYPYGKVENKGFEFMIGYKDRIGQLAYHISGVYTMSENKILEMAEVMPVWDYQRKTGLPMSNVFGLEAIGYYTSDDLNNPLVPSQTELGEIRVGDIRYRDQNNDGVIDQYDQVYLDDGDNHTQYAVNLELKFKGFDFGIQFLGQFGGSLGLNNDAAFEFYNNGGVREHHLNRYNPRDAVSYQEHGMKFYKGDYPRLSVEYASNNRQGSSFWRVPSDMLRLKTIQLGYSINPALLQKIKVSTLRFYISGYNLYTWSKTDLVDLEAGSGSGVIYPIQKIWNLGLNLSF